MRLLTVRRLLAVAALVWSVSALAASSDPCLAPDDAEGVVASLPRVAAALQPGRTLNVLAIGSATMFGPEASSTPGASLSQAPGAPPICSGPPQWFTKDASERAFPRQMAKALRAAVPGADVKITVRGGRGLLATDMLPILRTELSAHSYSMVIWQTGTVEAVRNLSPAEFGQVLSEGAEAVQAAGADLVLVDPQFSRFLQTNTNLDPYVQAMLQVAAMPGVVLFRRYDLMRSWVNDGQIDLERTDRPDRGKVVEILHACLGRHLAHFVLESARS